MKKSFRERWANEMAAKDICGLLDVPQGEVASFLVEDSAGVQKKIAVVHTENGNWYALNDRCTHGRVALSDGFVEDNCLECPRHGAQFDLETGMPVSPPATVPIEMYQLTIANDRIIIDLS